jgi:putative spermidine/putrescine transport system ATP-binding protein
VVRVNSGKNGQQKRGAAVRFENLMKSFGDVLAVNNISLHIQEGEFLTLLGPSGSGKTTTLMMVAGFEMPSSGEIFVGSESMTFKPPHKRNIGMVFQNYALFPHMTVADNISFPLKMRKVPSSEIKVRVKEVLKLVRLPGMEQRYPKQLSGGQQQRIALARALVFNPSVLLMDEPLGALDKKLREHMQLEIKHIQEELGITVIYVTHDQEEALTMSDRIAVMNEGRIEQVGRADELYEWPVNRFVADFIGESNFFEGCVEGFEENWISIACENEIRVLVPLQKEVEIGRTVCLALRPEKCLFVDHHEREHYNLTRGVIEDVVYVGEITKYRVKLPKGETFILKQQNRLGVKNHRRGDQVVVGWHYEDMRIVKK